MKDVSVPTSEMFENVDEIYHLAAFPDVKLSAEMTNEVFHNNVTATFNILENCRKFDIKRLAFASTSAIYGIAPIPTPEDHPLNAISNYAATKAACEALIRSYSETYGIRSVIFRFANIFGPRSRRGVMYDFFCKLKKNPEKLEILGDGEQNKAYLYIDDCMDAMEVATTKSKNKCDVYNIGSETQIKVNAIAEIVVKEMGLNNVQFGYTGGRQGWVGDVPTMLLDVSKLKNLGWKPRISTEQGIRMYIDWLKKAYR